MRSLPLAILVALAVPATASAAFAPPVSIPAPAGDAPRALAFGADGRGVAVLQNGGPPYSAGKQAIVTIPAGKRTTFADSVLLDSVRRSDGGVDLLVRRGSDLTKRGDLILRRVRPSGQIFDLWSVRTSATFGALTRGRDRTIVGWTQGTRLRLVSRPDGGIPSKPRSVRLSLRSPSRLDLAVDGRDRLVAAIATGRGLVLASLTTRGILLQRQERRVSGLVELAVTRGGRVGVLVQDTGIEGDGGECVGDGQGRHISVAVREPGVVRFGSTQSIESPKFGCGSTGASLRALPSNGLAVLYQGGSYDFPPLLARAATAPSGAPFGEPGTLATDARADTAVVDGSGRLVTALLRKTTSPEVYSGALSVLRGAGPEESISPGPVSSPLLGLSANGRAMLAWRAGDALLVAADQP